MDEFLSGIELIGAKMKILALNAGIQAAHADSGGAGLSVIAEAVQQLSTAALIQTSVVSRVLREITIESKDLFSDASFMNNERHGGVKVQLSELNRLLDSLKLTNSSVVTILQEIDTDSQQLASELDMTIRSISIHDDSAEMLTSVCSSLDEIHSYADKHVVDRRKDRDIDSVLKDLYSRYTMSSERDVHTLLSRGEEKSTNWQHSNDDAVSGDRKKSEFGANVELF
jgi:methyl-accepting chemotaxis protein